MTLVETAIEKDPARAIEVCRRAMIHDFMDTIKKDAVDKYVPVSMPASVGSLGFDTPIWVGLGIVGLWAALDAFAERAKLNRLKCATCEGKCIPATFASYTKAMKDRPFKNWKTYVICTPTIMRVMPIKNISNVSDMCLNSESLHH